MISNATDTHGVRTSTSDQTSERKPWRKPELRALPKLTELTLQSGGIIPGGGDGGGGGIF
jgi:hypothetical protein